MTGKRCTDCKHTKGIGYDFWCGEGHTEYEVFGAETNCPYYEYHDWSKGVPSRSAKRFKIEDYFAPPSVRANWVSGFLKWYVERLKEMNEEELEEILDMIRFDWKTFNGDFE